VCQTNVVTEKKLRNRSQRFIKTEVCVRRAYFTMGVCFSRHGDKPSVRVVNLGLHGVPWGQLKKLVLDSSGSVLTCLNFYEMCVKGRAELTLRPANLFVCYEQHADLVTMVSEISEKIDGKFMPVGGWVVWLDFIGPVQQSRGLVMLHVLPNWMQKSWEREYYGVAMFDDERYSMELLCKHTGSKPGSSETMIQYFEVQRRTDRTEITSVYFQSPNTLLKVPVRCACFRLQSCVVIFGGGDSVSRSRTDSLTSDYSSRCSVGDSPDVSMRSGLRGLPGRRNKSLDMNTRDMLKFVEKPDAPLSANAVTVNRLRKSYSGFL
jgi:hypothetical protein